MKNRFKIALMAVSVAACAGSAYAIPLTLTLSDGIPADTQTIVDGLPGDLNLNPGVVTYIGPVGLNWFVNVTTGISEKPTAFMDLNSVDQSLGAGHLTITLTDGPFLQNGAVLAGIGGTTAGMVSYTTTFTGPIGGGPGPFAGSTTGAAVGAPYNLTQTVDIFHRGAGVSSFDATIGVPDGGLTVALLGFAVMGVEGLRRRLSK
ncbi:MAG: VPDSG-CTERM sorting domain-containing protein [Verrucomicrobiota bacterium]|jgi:hypothetical protein